MRLARLALSAAILLTPVVLGGCGQVRDALGLTKNPPDEFSVVERAPLALPPSFALRPPTPGAPRPQEPSVTDRTRDRIFGTGQTAPSGGATAALAASRPESAAGGATAPAPAAAPRTPVQPDGLGAGQGVAALRQRLDLGKADANIRAVVDAETARVASADSSFVDKLLFWRKPEEPSGTLIDARAENRRLQENAALGRPANEGETATITRRKKGWLEGIF